MSRFEQIVRLVTHEPIEEEKKEAPKAPSMSLYNFWERDLHNQQLHAQQLESIFHEMASGLPHNPLESAHQDIANFNNFDNEPIQYILRDILNAGGNANFIEQYMSENGYIWEAQTFISREQAQALRQWRNDLRLSTNQPRKKSLLRWFFELIVVGTTLTYLYRIEWLWKLCAWIGFLGIVIFICSLYFFMLEVSELRTNRTNNNY
jgi:hypothetical protein